MENRKRYLSNVQTMVIKLGTQLLSDAEGRLDATFVAHIAEQVAALRSRGIKVTIVSSGAVGAGVRELQLQPAPHRPGQAPGRRGRRAAAADGCLGRRLRAVSCPSHSSC